MPAGTLGAVHGRPYVPVMRHEASTTAISWIPSEAVKGMTKMPFELGFTHYDEAPPDDLSGTSLEELRNEDRFRFANELSAWIEVDERGQVVDFGQDGKGWIGVTKIMGRSVDVRAVPLPEVRPEPEVGRGWVRFTQSAGGRTGVPAPRHVDRPPFVQVGAPLAWSTLTLTLHADGRAEHALAGASPFPRHWVYGPDGKLTHKTGLIDFKAWYRNAFGKHSPWGNEDSPALVTAVETALERDLSSSIMRPGARPEIRKLKAGDVITRQGDTADWLYLVLDGVVRADVDGEPVVELGPGAVMGERAVLEGGVRTSTNVAVTRCTIAVAPADDVDRDALVELSEGHRRESAR